MIRETETANFRRNAALTYESVTTLYKWFSGLLAKYPPAAFSHIVQEQHETIFQTFRHSRTQTIRFSWPRILYMASWQASRNVMTLSEDNVTFIDPCRLVCFH